MRLIDGVRWIINLDQGFRAPNLDDLTSRQPTGAGQQYENPNAPARASALTLETGLKIERPRRRAAGVRVPVDGSIGLIGRVAASTSATSARRAGQHLLRGDLRTFRLVNIAGHESRSAGSTAPCACSCRRALACGPPSAYAWGDGPNPVAAHHVRARAAVAGPPAQRHRRGQLAPPRRLLRQLRPALGPAADPPHPRPTQTDQPDPPRRHPRLRRRSTCAPATACSRTRSSSSCSRTSPTPPTATTAPASTAPVAGSTC